MASPETRTAGAFDIRNIIGGLMGIYGVVLVVTGLFFTDAAQRAKVGGENLNLQVGIGLLVFAALMIGWALLRPLRVPADPVTSTTPPSEPT